VLIKRADLTGNDTCVEKDLFRESEINLIHGNDNIIGVNLTEGRIYAEFMTAAVL